jgi:DNA-binding response OmpR family regulator
MKVLVADDENDIRRLVVFTLKRAGFDIIEASDGRQALEQALANANDVDLIILDVMMPYMDGYEVCRQLRANASTANVPVLFLSAKGQNYEIGQGLNAGATDYIVKPFVPKDLAAKAKQLLGVE